MVTHGVDVRWLTGLVASNAQFLLSADADGDVLFTDNRYAEPAEATGLPVVLQSWVGDVDQRAATIGFQAEHVTVTTHAALRDAVGADRLHPTTAVLATARRVKDTAELARLEEACRITDDGWRWLQDWIEPGMTEAAVGRELVRHLEDLGAEGPAFDPIVAAGPNSAVPHHRPTARPVAAGEVLKVDFGARVEGYHADCTRVLAIGSVPGRLAEVHALVAEAQAAGVAAAIDGAAAGAVDAAAIGWLEGQAAGPTLHGVGHGVGLEIHESPILSAEPAATLQNGFVITVEPGIYLAGVGGIRIEDTVAVTSSGPRRLTTCPRDLVVV